MSEPGKPSVEVSVVMPCLNEEQSVGMCVRKALAVIRENHIRGEVIVVDNGSADRSVEEARQAGAVVFIESKRGYGCAYQTGIRNARGVFVIMGDSDDTYDFSSLMPFVQKLREGYSFVNGNRLRNIERGAMPFHHRYIGNPLLTGMLNVFFNSGFSDVYCGMKAFSKAAYEEIKPISCGMEFALELIINASRRNLKRTEVSVTLKKRLGYSKLRPLQDGWRSLRFMLMYCPNYLFLLPGGLLLGLGILGMAALFNGPVTAFGHTFDFHALICAAMMALLGFQVISVGFFAKGYALSHGYERKNSFFLGFYKYFHLEAGILAGLFLFLAGVFIGFGIIRQWVFVSLIPQERQALLAFTLILIGAQMIFSSFLISLMSLRNNRV